MLHTVCGDPMDSFSRVKKIFSHCDPSIDAIIIKNGTEPCIDNMFFYVTGISTGLFEGCAAVIYKDKPMKLLISTLEEDIAKQSSMEIYVYTTTKEFYDLLQQCTSSCSTIGLSFQNISFSDYIAISKKIPYASFQDISLAFVSARMIKDENELSKIQKACRIADKVMEKIPQFIRKDMTERELAAEIDYHLMKYGADAPAFETISSFGIHTALPHHSHGDRTIRKGDFIICDFGARVEKYHSDMTRTFVFGSANPQQKKMHQVVLHAQETGIQLIRAGIIAKDVHEHVFDTIQGTEFSGRFIHSTGHSLGLLVHDGGIGFHSQCVLPLKEHMVLTVEPGIYIPDVGGVRIEDDIVVTKNGCNLLTSSTRDLIEI